MNNERAKTKNIYLPNRGILVEIPPDWSKRIIIPTNGDIIIDKNTKTKIQAVHNDSILKNRYPHPEDGAKFMEQICPEWRQFLYTKAEELSNEIIEKAAQEGFTRLVTVLFGSVSKNLVKSPSHSDPSNIDLLLLADFPRHDRDRLLDCIRPIREKTSQEIMREQGRKSTNPIEGVGVIAQNYATVENDHLMSVRQRIISCGRPLYDPDNIWKSLEAEATPYIEAYNLPGKARKKALAELAFPVSTQPSRLAYAFS